MIFSWLTFQHLGRLTTFQSVLQLFFFIIAGNAYRLLMILEIATLYVSAGRQKKFEEDFKTAKQYISSVKGFKSLTLQKNLEQNNKYVLLVRWEKIEDHLIGFRQSKIYNQWKELLHHYYDPFPVVEHYETVVDEHR